MKQQLQTFRKQNDFVHGLQRNRLPKHCWTMLPPLMGLGQFLSALNTLVLSGILSPSLTEPLSEVCK
jgi:hypothetical protein